MVHCICCVHSVPALDLHAHTQCHCLVLLGQRGGGVHVLKYNYSYSL